MDFMRRNKSSSTVAQKPNKIDMSNFDIEEENGDDNDISAFEGSSIGGGDESPRVNLKMVPDDGSVVSDGTKSFHEPKPKGRPIPGISYDIDMVRKDKVRGVENDVRSSQSSERDGRPTQHNSSNKPSSSSHNTFKKFGVVAPLRNRVDMTSQSDGGSNGSNGSGGVPGFMSELSSNGSGSNGSNGSNGGSRTGGGGLLDEDFANQFSDGGSAHDEEDAPEELSYEEIQNRKDTGLAKLARLEEQGYTSAKKHSMTSDLDEIEKAVTKLTAQRELDKSIKFQRKLLMGFVTVAEYLNTSYDPFELKLEGWSEAVYENIADYDEVFEELHEKYKDQISIGPELKLLGMLAGSAMMFHFSRTLFAKAKSQVPGFDQVMNSDPELKRRYQEQAAKLASNNGAATIAAAGNGGNNPLAMIGQMFGGLTGNSNMGNIVAGMMGGGKKQPQSGVGQKPNGQSQPQPQPQQQQQQTQQHPQPPAGPQRRTKRQPMKPIDDDVDDLLSSLTGGPAKQQVEATEEEIDISEIDNLSDLSSSGSKP